MPDSSRQPLGPSRDSGWEGLSQSMICSLLVSPVSSWDIPSRHHPSLLLPPENCLQLRTATLSSSSGPHFHCTPLTFTRIIPPCPLGLGLCITSSREPSLTSQTGLGSPPHASFARVKHQTQCTMIFCGSVCLPPAGSDVPGCRDSFCFPLNLFFFFLINLFLAVLGLRCADRGLLFVAVCSLLIAVASLVAEQGL